MAKVNDLRSALELQQSGKRVPEHMRRNMER